jgi:ankyrin repeat protein
MLKYKKYNYEVFNFFIKINSKYKSQCNFIKKLKLNDLIENLKFSINNNFKFLSEYIFDILIKKRKNNKFRSSLLFVLIYCNNNEIINYLVEKLLKLNKDIKNIKYNNDFTALHSLVCKNNLEGVKIILQHNLKIDLRNNKNYTALHLASSNGNIEIVKLLLKYGADKDLKVNDLTALEIAEKTKERLELTGDNRKYLYPKIIDLLK